MNRVCNLLSLVHYMKFNTHCGLEVTYSTIKYILSQYHLEINQQRCAQLLAGAVSLLRPPVNRKMVRPAVSLLNYCISGHRKYKFISTWHIVIVT